MATTIDHLSVDHVIHVTQPFVDARGVAHDVGESGLIRALGFDQRSNEITIRWERDGAQETMFFLASNRNGPGIGRMKQYFEIGEYVPPEIEGKRLIPGVGYVPIAQPLPPLTDDVIRTDARYDDAIDRVWALAGRQRFDEAHEQLAAILSASDRNDPNNDHIAESICRLARNHAFDADLTVYRWPRERGIELWYSWGAQATSGGDGSYRATKIRAAEHEFIELDRKLGR